MSCCSISLCCWSSLNAKERPKSPVWQINGLVAALENRNLDSFPDDVDGLAFEQIRHLNQLDLVTYRQDAKVIIEKAIADLRQTTIYTGRLKGASQVLEKFAANDPEILQFLRDIANNTQKSATVRCSAVQSLSNLGQVDRQISQMLIALVENTQEPLEVRTCATESFNQLEPRDSKIVPVLQNLLYSPKTDATLRGQAAIALIQLGDNSPNLQSTLLKLAQDRNNDLIARSRALEALGHLKSADPQTIQALVRFMQTETEDSWYRSDAANAVSNLVKVDHPDLSRLLIQALKSPHKHEWLDTIAIDTLIKWGATDPTYQNLMLDILVNPQSNSNIRSSIMYTIVKTNLFDTNPSLIQVLSDFAKNPRVEPKTEFALGKRAISKLGQLGGNNIRIREMITAIAKERWTNLDRRQNAIEALVNWSKSNPRDRQILLDILNNPKEDLQVRLLIAEKIGAFQPLTLSQLFLFVSSTHYSVRNVQTGRFNAYFYGQGTEEIQLLMQWLGRPTALPDLGKMTPADRRKTLQVFLTVWPDSEGFEKSRVELVKAITLIISSSQWTKTDIPLLEQHYQNLNRPQVPDFNEASIIKGVLDSLR